MLFIILASCVTGVVLGDQNTNNSAANPKTKQVNFSSTSTTTQDNKKCSTFSAKPAQTKSPEGIS